MRVALLWVPARRPGPALPGYVRSLSGGMESLGHQVDVVDAWSGEGRRLPGYGYVAVLAEQVGVFGGVMPEVLSRTLESAQGLAGRKGAALLKKTGPFTGKALINLMRAMEREGMVVNRSDVVLSPAHAEALGRRIGA